MRAVDREEFESFVREGVENIPERFRSRIKNVVFLVRSKPTTAQRRREGLRRGETLFGLYEGIPHTARGEGYGAFVMPDKITIFKQPIEEEASLLLCERLRGRADAPETNTSADNDGRSYRYMCFQSPVQSSNDHAKGTSPSCGEKQSGRGEDSAFFLAKQDNLFRAMVRRIVMDTVWHEVAHHFGLDEKEVAKRERERQKRSH